MVQDRANIAPVMSELVGGEPRIVGNPKAQAGFTVLEPGTYLVPHFGPSNEQITCHLGLRIPEVGLDVLGISVGGERRRWEVGKWVCFEDSFEHYVWNDANESRVVLLANILHPRLPTPKMHR